MSAIVYMVGLVMTAAAIHHAAPHIYWAAIPAIIFGVICLVVEVLLGEREAPYCAVAIVCMTVLFVGLLPFMGGATV